jgi:hypothetical protein
MHRRTRLGYHLGEYEKYKIDISYALHSKLFIKFSTLWCQTEIFEMLTEDQNLN